MRRYVQNIWKHLNNILIKDNDENIYIVMLD